MRSIITEVFSESPNKWGLKGDVDLWEDMKQYFLDLEDPDSEDDFLLKLNQTFENITGKPAIYNSFIFVDRYSGKEFTSGMVDPRSWDRVIFPLLTSRFREYRQSK